MRNFLHDDESVNVPAPMGGTTSGIPVLIGRLFGVPQTTQSAGELVNIKCCGAFRLAKHAGHAFAVGDMVEWDVGSSSCMTSGTANGCEAGVCIEAAASGDAWVKVMVCCKPATLVAD